MRSNFQAGRFHQGELSMLAQSLYSEGAVSSADHFPKSIYSALEAQGAPVITDGLGRQRPADGAMRDDIRILAHYKPTQKNFARYHHRRRKGE
jgi:hypothetical protein